MLTAFAGQTVKIAFYGESTVSNGDNDLHIDNVMVSDFTSCAKPTDLSVVATTASSVTVAWTENGTATAWDIEYGLTGFQHGSGTAALVTAGTNPFTISGLSDVTYDVYVRANCGDEQSNWAGPLTVTPGVYSMGATGSDTLTACSLTIYDNGGVNGNYSANCNYTLVIYPETAGAGVAVSGTYNTEENWDFLRIFDGVGTDGTMLGEFSGIGTMPVLVASAGPLTIQFTSDGGVQRAGFVLNIECASCMPPGNLTVSNLNATSVDLSWTGSFPSYVLQYKAADDTVWVTETTSDTAFSLSGLTPITEYTANVFGYCGDALSPAATVTFFTPMVAAPIPFSTDFSSTDDLDWLFYNGTCLNTWAIGSLGDTVNVLFVTNNGTTATYNPSSFSTVSVEKLFAIGETGDVEISFDVEVEGEDQFDYIKVFFAPVDTMYPAARNFVDYAELDYSLHAVDFSEYMQYSGYSSYPYKYNLTGGNIVHVSVVMPNPNLSPEPTSTAKLVFLWHNDQSQGSQLSAIIHNVSIQALTCPRPTQLTLSNLTPASVDVSWNEGGDEDSWILEYKVDSDTTWISIPVSGTSTYALSGLEVGAAYQVRVMAVCGDDMHSQWATITFTTPCDAITVFPYTEDFEHDGSMPDCWSQEFVHGLVSWTMEDGTENSAGIESAHSGSYNAFFNDRSRDNISTRLVTPVFDLTGLSNPYVTYWYAQKAWVSDLDRLSVYYRTGLDDEWHLLTQYYNSVAIWTMDSLALPNPSATYQLAFTGLASYGYGIVLDDIVVNGEVDTTVVPEPCDAPIGLHATNIGNHEITIGWDDNVNVNSWNIQYRVANGSWTSAQSSTNSYTITGLQGLTTYEIKVQADCGDNLSEWSSPITVQTTNVGLEERLEKSVSLYPNPAKEYVDIRVDGDVNVTLMEVIDVYGKLINAVAVVENPTRLNVSGLADGMYFVRVTTDVGVVTKPFVKR
jgi:hypothetical protein